MDRISYQKKHELVEDMISRGVDLQEIKELLGHASSDKRQQSDEDELKLSKEEFFVLKKGRYAIRLNRKEASVVCGKLKSMLSDNNEEEDDE